jgi:hypothetical protein
MRNASYRGIPCWYNPINEEVIGKNWMYDKIISFLIFVDVYLLEVEEFKLWVEVDQLEKH